MVGAGDLHMLDIQIEKIKGDWHKWVIQAYAMALSQLLTAIYNRAWNYNCEHLFRCNTQLLIKVCMIMGQRGAGGGVFEIIVCEKKPFKANRVLNTVEIGFNFKPPEYDYLSLVWTDPESVHVEISEKNMLARIFTRKVLRVS